MTLSRFKIMAGILGVSIGGLAAVAGQCPRPDTPHRSGDGPPDSAKVPNAGSKGGALPAVPPPPLDVPPPAVPSPVGVDLPSLPAIPATAPTKLPELPPVTPAKAEMPKPAALPTPVVIPTGGTALPDVPPALPAAPTPPKTEVNAPPAPPVLPAPASVPATPVTPIAAPPAPPTAVVPAPYVEPPRPATTPTVEPIRPVPAPVADPAPQRATPIAGTVPQAAAVANRFRILLRVGEGEPTFEVKSGDDLVLRVVCEKVDVKSPERGQGPSSVTATGRVRFVGFGAEGTCDSLSFLAGTGEVAMTGAVRVQVKDKIGRVESELTSDRVQYRLDAAGPTGNVRP